jgi:putative transposase
MVAEHGVSVRQACRAVRLARSAFYAPRRPRDDSPIVAAIQRYVGENPTQGFDKLYPALRAEGFGKCRLYRVYRALRLNIKRRGKRRLPARVKVPLLIPAEPNEVWSADFMADALWSGRRFRTFNVLEDFNREALRIEIDTNLPARRVVRALEELIELRGPPAVLRVDNGPELSATRSGSGRVAMVSSFGSYNRVGPCRTASSNASTEPIERRCSTATCSKP